MNKSLPKKKVHTLELDETETRALLLSDSVAVSPELKEKMRQFGLDDGFISIAGRNARLALNNLKERA